MSDDENDSELEGDQARQRRVTEVFGEGTVVDEDQDAVANEVAARFYAGEQDLDELWRERAVVILESIRAELAERPPCVIAAIGGLMAKLHAPLMVPKPFTLELKPVRVEGDDVTKDEVEEILGGARCSGSPCEGCLPEWFAEPS